MFVDRPPDVRIRAFGVNRGALDEDIRRQPYDIPFEPWADFDPRLSTCAQTNGLWELICWSRDGKGAAFLLERDGRCRGRPRPVTVSPAALHERLTEAEDCGWRARVDPSRGTLTVSDPSGAVRFSRSGLDRPSHVAFVNGRIAVRTRGPIAKYRLR